MSYNSTNDLPHKYIITRLIFLIIGLGLLTPLAIGIYGGITAHDGYQTTGSIDLEQYPTLLTSMAPYEITYQYAKGSDTFKYNVRTKQKPNLDSLTNVLISHHTKPYIPDWATTLITGGAICAVFGLAFITGAILWDKEGKSAKDQMP